MIKEKLNKISMNKKASNYLDKMKAKIKDDITCKNVTKKLIIDWIIEYFYKNLFDKLQNEMKESFFDKVTYLEVVIQKYKKLIKENKLEEADKTLTELLKNTQKQSKKIMKKL